MPNFVFAYRRAAGTGLAPEAAASWMAWFDGMGGHLADIGKPAEASTAIGNCGPGTELGGYSLITADDLDAAQKVAQGCPALARGGGVEIAQLGDVPPSSA
jgi:hypothetical protein